MSQFQLLLNRDFVQHCTGVQFARYRYFDEDKKELVILSQTICNDKKYAGVNDKLAVALAKKQFGADTEVKFV